MTPLVSVIVPIYNAEKYLSQCLEALTNQTLKDIEIICVDDGSTDGSAEIAKKHAEKDERISYIYQINQGRSAARNTGIKHSTAPYLMFCDSDDWYEQTMCEKLYNAITKNDVDFACCGIKMEYEISDTSSKESDEEYYRVKFSGVQNIKQSTWVEIDASSCNKIFKKELLNKYDIKYPYGLVYEDFCFFFQLLCVSEKMYCLPEYLYHYRRHNGSIMVETFSSINTKALDHLKIMWIIRDFLLKNNLWSSRKKIFYVALLACFGFSYRYLPKDKKYLAFDEAITFMKQVTQTDLSLLSDAQKQTWDDILNKTYDEGYVKKIKIGGITFSKIKQTKTKFTFSIFGLRLFAKRRKNNKEKFYILYIPVFKKAANESILSMAKMGLQKIFSSQNSSDKKHKIITILGFKLKFKKDINDTAIIYHKTLKKLKKEIHHRKLRVCFLVNETSKWNAQSLYDEMKNSKNFEPFIVVTNLQNRVGRSSYAHILEFYRSCADNVKIGWDEETKQGIDLKTFNPDIVFYQQPWELYENQNVRYVSEFALTYYFSYAISDSIHCVKYLYDDFFALVRKYFVFSEAEKEEYQIKMQEEATNLAAVGHPKLDIYKNYHEEDYEHKYVIYAPHHSFEENSLNFATFQWNGKYILEYAEKHPEFNWVFKPHPRFKAAIIQNNIMSAKEIEEYYARWEKIGKYYNDGLYFDLFKQAKCLITDCGSFLIEFLPTKQPVIFLVNPQRHDDIPSTKIISDSYYQILTLEELEKALDEILVNNIDPLKPERLQILKKLNIEKYDSTSKIINEIKKDLGL